MAIISSTDIGNGRVQVVVDHDPTVVATDVLTGSLIIENGTGIEFIKLDDGATTNVAKQRDDTGVIYAGENNTPLTNVQNIKNNFVASSDPTANDDNTAGYEIGSKWVNTTTQKEFTCTNASTAAAVWKETTPGGVGPHELGGASHNADTLANLNSKVTDATLDDSASSRPAQAHNLGGSEHNADTLANLNAKVTDATLDDSAASRTPTAHVTSHQNGGGDEMNVGGLSGTLADPQTAAAHNLGGSEHNADTLANLNAKVTDATLDDSASARTPTAHNLGGAEHNADTLANLNTKVTDATLDDSSASRTPTAHAASHADGAADELFVEGQPTTGSAGTVPVAQADGSLQMEVPDSGATDQVRIFARKGSGGTINKGQPVYISGYNAGVDRAEVELAQANSGTTMPAIGIADTSITSGADGVVVISGRITGIDTATIGSVGDDVYVDGAVVGTLVNTKPTGTNQIQKVAQILRSHGSLGVIEVFGAGRQNDLPNIANGNVWVGNGSGVPTETTFSHANVSGVTSDQHHAQVHDLGGADHNSATLAQLNAKVSDATLDDSASSRPAQAHNLGGSEHNADTLANLNAKVTDATLDDSSASRTPTAHAASHESAGGDQIAHQNLSGAGTNTHAQIDTHIASVANPHSVTNTQVGLGNVTDDAQLKRAANDFSTFTEKGTPVGADLILIEDSAAAGVKKKVQITNLPGGGGGKSMLDPAKLLSQTM
jgi:hypothetical protein